MVVSVVATRAENVTNTNKRQEKSDVSCIRFAIKKLQCQVFGTKVKRNVAETMTHHCNIKICHSFAQNGVRMCERNCIGSKTLNRPKMTSVKLYDIFILTEKLKGN